MKKLLIVFLLSPLLTLAQVVPSITISNDKSVISLGETVSFSAVYTGGGLGPRLVWKKNGIVVGTNSTNYSDNSLKDGDKIACVLTSNDAQRVLNVVASNFLSPKVNPVKINPTLSSEGIVGKPINLNANITEKVVWKKDGVRIPNPLTGFLGDGVTVAGEGTNFEFRDTRGIFYEPLTKTLYVLDQTRVLKFSNNSLIGNVIIDQLNSPSDIWVDKEGKIYISFESDIKIFEPGSSTPNSVIQYFTGPNRMFVADNGDIYLSSFFMHIVEKYDQKLKTFNVVAGTKNVSGDKLNLLHYPSGLFVNSKNEIFIADQNNHRIVKWIAGENAGVVVAGGNGQGGFNNIIDNKLSYPTDVAVDKNELVFVSEYSNSRITKWESNQKCSLVIGGNGQGTALNKMASNVKGFKMIDNIFYINDAGNKRILEWKTGDQASKLIAGNFESNYTLFTPRDIKFNKGEFYISDWGYYRIQKWNISTKKGEMSFNFGTNPTFIDFDSSNNLFVSDILNNKVQKWNNISFSTYAGSTTSGNSLNLLFKPGGIKFDKNDNLLIVDSGNNRILKWPKNAIQGTLVAGIGTNGNSSVELNDPRDIEIDSEGNYYVLDSGNNRIQKFSNNSQNGETIYGLNTPIGMQLNKPTSLFLNANMDLIIADIFNHRIIKFNTKNLTSTIIAGGNGKGSAANQLSSPYKAIEDSEGNLLVVDTNNSRIQKFTIENNQSFLPTVPGNYSATITTQFGEFTTPSINVVFNDSDKDGVEDSLDKCPETPSGTKVDSKGCSDDQNICYGVKPTIIISPNFVITTSTTGSKYGWYLDDQLIFEGNSQSFSPVKSGKYSLKVYVNNKCFSSMSDYVSVLITGNQLEHLNLNVYPNPFNKEVKVQLPIEFGEHAKMSIVDLNGTLVYSKEDVIDKEIISLNNLNAGVYFMTIESKNSFAKNVIKLVKE
jgi:hypothetical protein